MPFFDEKSCAFRLLNPVSKKEMRCVMPPLSIMIKPASSLCNMRCTYCFYEDEVNNRSIKNYGIMSQDTLEKIVKRAFIYATHHVSFAFQGGEPTLAGAPFFRAFSGFLRKYKKGQQVNCSIQTNGLHLSDELLDVLAENNFLVGVSLDGTKETHDALRPDAKRMPTYDRIVANIQKMQERGIPFNILCVISKTVAKQGKAVLEDLKKYEYVQFIPCLDNLDGVVGEEHLTQSDYATFLKDTFDIYQREFWKGNLLSIRNFDNYIGILTGRAPENCAMRGICEHYYLFESNGNCYPCDFYALDEWKMGNIHEANFISLSKSPLADAFRNRSLHKEDACKTCTWFTLCRGGCCRDREPFMDGKPQRYRHCQALKEFFSYAIEGMTKMAKALSEGQKR